MRTASALLAAAIWWSSGDFRVTVAEPSLRDDLSDDVTKFVSEAHDQKRELVSTSQVAPILLVSPDASVEVTLEVESQKLFYKVRLDDDSLIENAELAIKRGRRADKVEGSLTVLTEASQVDDGYTALWGPRRSVENSYTLFVAQVNLKKLGRVTLETRVFNDGVAFRLLFPVDERRRRKLGETHSIQFSGAIKETNLWAARGWKEVVGPTSLDKFKKALGRQSELGKDAKSPVTARIGKNWISFHEGALIDAEGFDIKVRNGPQRTKRLDLSSTYTIEKGVSFSSAWRTVQVARSAAELTTSDLVRNVNPPPSSDLSVDGNALSDWVKPGLVMWDWRTRGSVDSNGFKFELNAETIKRAIDFCQAQGVPYMLIDDGWYNERFGAPKGNPLRLDILDVKALAAYATTKSVGLWLYIDLKVLQSANKEKVLRTYHEWGVKGIKHGFATNKKSKMPEIYHEMREVLELCQKYELLYMVHEPPKPSGWSRTFPHLLTTEYTDSQFDNPKKRATTRETLTTLPFVQHLAAGVDRSPAMFALDTCITRNKIFRQVPYTVMSQVAQAFVFPTGAVTLIDTDESYLAKPQLWSLLVEMNDFFAPDESTPAGQVGSSYMLTKKLGTKYITCAIARKAGALEVDMSLFLPSNFKSLTIQKFLDGDADGAISDAGPEIPRKQSQIDAIAQDTTKREIYEVQSQTLTKSQALSSPLQVPVANGGGFCLKIVVRT